MRTLNAAGTALEWRNTSFSAAAALPTSSNLMAYGAPAQYYKFAGVMVGVRGTLKRVNGSALSTGSEVVLGTLPAGFRPWHTQRFCLVGGYGSNYQTGRVYVQSSGVITMEDPDHSMPWIDLSGINFRSEN